MATAAELIPDGFDVSTTMSAVMVYGFALIPGVAVLLIAAVRTIRTVRRARALGREILDGAHRPLRAGPALVRGRVVVLGDEEGARPDFAYAGHRFALRLASGETLEVDAGRFVRTDQRSDGDDDLAVVRDGEELLVRGVLVEEPDPAAASDGGSYRDLPTMRLALAGRGERRAVEITAASAAPAARVGAEAAWMGWALLVLLIAHAPLVGYHLRSAFGEVRLARVAATDARATSHSGRGAWMHEKNRYELLLEGPGESDWVRVSRDEYLRARVGDVVPRIGYAGFDNFGHTPRAAQHFVIFAVGLMAIFVWRYRTFTRTKGRVPTA